MKKDIPFEKVKDIAVAILPDNDPVKADIWEVYLINLKDEDIESVLVSSKGYGQLEGKDVKTTTMRQFLGTLKANSFKLIEPIEAKLFGISNEFWVSFRWNGVMYDKKYVFVTESIIEANFTEIPLLHRLGVMIK